MGVQVIYGGKNLSFSGKDKQLKRGASIFLLSGIYRRVFSGSLFYLIYGFIDGKGLSDAGTELVWRGIAETYE